MDFSYSPEQLAIKEVVADFAKSEIEPLIPRMEHEKRTPRDLIQKMKKMDFYGLQYPEEYGGAGLSSVEYVIMLEELAKVYCSIAGHIAVNNLCAGTINDFGTESQKREYLPQLLAGDAIGSFAFTESETGSNPRAIRTTCVRDGDEWVINGEKLFITNSTIPGYAIIFCKDVEADGKLTAIIVPKDAKGYSTPRLVEKMGMNGMEVADVVLDNVRVPYQNTVGGEAGRGRGFRMLTTEVAYGKLGISAQCVGMAQAALEASVRYARERKQMDQPIGNFQTIQWIIGEMSAEVEAARCMTLATACRRAQGMDIYYDAARTRLFTSQVAHRAASNAMQVHGAFGYTTEFPVERIYRDAKLAEIYEGVNEIQRVIAAAEYLK